jgi:hypothetical protein
MGPSGESAPAPRDSFLQQLRKGSKRTGLSKLPDEIQAELELMRSAPLTALPDAPEPIEPWDLFWATDPKAQEIEQALTEIRKRFGSDSVRLFFLLLDELVAVAPAALGADGEIFARVIAALRLAVERNDLQLLFERKRAEPEGFRSGTIVEVAERYLARQKKETDFLVGIPRVDFVRWLAAWFDPVPEDEQIEHRAETVAVNLLFKNTKTIKKFAKRAPSGTWRECRDRIKAECRAVGNRIDPRPIDYATAVLRGWGLGEKETQSWTDPLRRTRKKHPAT